MMVARRTLLVLVATAAVLLAGTATAQDSALTPDLRGGGSYPAPPAEPFEEMMGEIKRSDFNSLVEKYMAHLEKLEDSGAEPPEVRDFETTLKKYWSRHPDYLQGLRNAGGPPPSPLNQTVEEGDGLLNLVEVSSQMMAPQGGCEVCVYVIENKEQHQPFLCRGLRSAAYQQTCVSVLVSLMWWLENQVYWVNYGCQSNGQGSWEWVKPCPAHAICSFIQSLYDRTPFCPKDEKYRKPVA